ncbi:T9SS type A sorting domain-containing protein [Flavobacterium sp. Sr18]|uniref:T9SS type A sorting domain-containing protein n=1 Tax=Flavobacterium sp. Sr18 TaxID=935222 RepID=UPI0013E4B88A|nr:T9SS type A sorting domain-containing protein [Flavobacterium sp. Sr18]QIH37455.1 T9SS type A sorting domain-containing protein [Flavobacterium sp. Sr18]
MRYLLILFTVTFQGQVMHHQMLSSQGQSTRMPDGLMIKQTIGQQSVTGNSIGNAVVIQGFQQSLWSNYIVSNDKIEITTLTYPNPFTETVNFQFSEPVIDLITITVFDILGRLIFEQKKASINTILTINLAQLSRSEYLVRLNASKFTLYTKIIKQ